MTVRIPLSRRRFLATAAASTAVSAAGGIGKPYLSRAADRPVITHGIQSGDVSVDSAVIWARADRPARMLAEVATTDSFKNSSTTATTSTPTARSWPSRKCRTARSGKTS